MQEHLTFASAYYDVIAQSWQSVSQSVTDRVRPECTVVETGPSGVQSAPSSRLDRPEKAVDKVDRTQHGVRRRRDQDRSEKTAVDKVDRTQQGVRRRTTGLSWQRVDPRRPSRIHAAKGNDCSKMLTSGIWTK